MLYVVSNSVCVSVKEVREVEEVMNKVKKEGKFFKNVFVMVDNFCRIGYVENEVMEYNIFYNVY